MRLIEIGIQIQWLKENLLMHLVNKHIFPLKRIKGKWVSVFKPKQYIEIGSDIFSNSKKVKVTLDQEIHVDAFPVSIIDYIEFVKSGHYFKERYWPGYRVTSCHNGGDDIIRKILEPTNYSCEWTLMKHIPVTNITWFEAYAYSRWAKKLLVNEMLWEYAAVGTKEKDIEIKLNNIKNSLLSKKSQAKLNFDITSFSKFGCWGMLGGIIEWCGDKFINAAFLNFIKGPIIIHNDEITNCNVYINKRGFLYGDSDAAHKENIAKRQGSRPLDLSSDIGFRCCKLNSKTYK